MIIGIQGAISAYSGYGNDSIGLALALRKAGHQVSLIPTAVETGLPTDIAMLLTLPPQKHLDATIVHAPPRDLKPLSQVRSRSPKVIGWTMWEQTKLNSDHMKGSGRWPFRDLDLILAYDPVSRGALSGFDPSIRVDLLQGGVDADFWPYTEKDWSGTFRFGMLGQLHERKDPFCAIEAFHELRQDGELQDAELLLKTNITGLHPKIGEIYPGVQVITDVWNREEVRKFVQSLHVYLAPSKGEGKNLPALETQLSGGVALATGWGGHTMWQHPHFSPAIDYTLVPVAPGSDSLFAQASKDHLKTLMLDLYNDRRKAKELGRIASGAIRAQCDWSAVVRRLERFLS